MRVFVQLLVGIVLLVCTTSGCGPALTEDDLGIVIEDQDELPTTGETYPPPRRPGPEILDPAGTDPPAHEH